MAFRLALAGAHLSGLGLNHQLTDLGAKLVQVVRTAPVYRMYDLGPKPALIRQLESAPGFEIELEVWEIPIANVGAFIRCACPCRHLAALTNMAQHKLLLGNSTSTSGH